METETSQTNEQLAPLDQRLTAVERNLAVLTVEVAVLTKTAATKEDLMHLHRVLGADIARIDATLAAMLQNGATKADLAALETRIMKWMIATLIGVGALNSTLVLIVVKLMQP
ncbi:hypothetical protein GTP45_13540 [Pseudoduganella sp. FT55W]|uniref:DUF1640 domain-containing protein n=1 Tax=Duganella rivi TaxID=2666083 RepID=A0A7X4GRH6_9BURK|nr:hypothetical protein [Duganella rivi]MYM67850.1 hypothetical protein [Duganella rivi]